MPKNPVTDPITDQEMAFAHLILSGTMNDRRAAEAVGLNPDTAASTKAKPRVRAYMIEQRAAFREKLVAEEAEGLRPLHITRDQILNRLWELAALHPEVTKGSMAGQIKALSMIVAIEGLIPNRPNDRRRSQPHATRSEPADAVTAVEAHPAAPQVPEPEPPSTPANTTPFPHLDRNQANPFNPFVHPEKTNPVPESPDYIYDAVLNASGPLGLPLSLKNLPFPNSR